MATEVKLPELGEGVTEGELVKWLVKPGDSVKADQPIAEIMTDKATVEVPSPQAGVVKDLKFKAGEVIKVESVMLTLDGSGAAISKPAPAQTSKPAPAAAPAPKMSSAPAPKPSSGGGKVIDIKLPELGEGVTEGELVKWLVKPGDSVKADQAIAEIMTDKATVEVPSPQAGVVKDLKFKAGEVVKVESTMLTLETSGGGSASTWSPAATSNGSASKPSTPSTQPSTQSAPTMMTAGAGVNFYPPAAESKVLATPATRRLAREMGIDINLVSGSGLAGRVTREDVLNAKGGGASQGAGATRASTPQSALTIPKPAYQSSQGAAETREPLRGIRKKVAENLQMAKHVIPHFTLMEEAEVTELVSLRESLKEYAEKNQTKVTYLPFVMKALIATIREFPMFNASIDDQAQEIVYKKYFNIGFAADTPQGLLVPVIKDADRKSILEISREIIDLSHRARDGKLKLEEMKGATITITNIGSVGGTYATPIINHPEVAILGMYKIQDKPVIKDGKLEAIKVMNYTITCDHRLIDGAVAARFMKAFVGRIQKPGTLMMEMA